MPVLATIGAVGAAAGGVAQGVNALSNPKAGVNPQAPNLIQGANAGQAAQSYDQTQAGLAQQAAFVAALQGQNGVQNQTDVYNQLQGIAAGQGPNPAQAMLNNATGANVAQQAALAGSQRGASQNVGMIARQAAQQGAQIQQNAVGQGAAMQANQSLNAIGQAGGIAGQQVGQQQGAINAYNAAAQGQQANVLGAINAQNAAAVNAQNNINSVQGQQALQAQQNQANAIGGLASGLGTAAAYFAPQKPVPVQTAGGAAAAGPVAPPGSTSSGGMTTTPIYKASGGEIAAIGKENYGPRSHVTKHLMAFAKGGEVPAKVSPGEIYLPPAAAKAVAQGKVAPSQAGERIPGQAKVKGDSLKNDTVSKNLEVGGVVVPRTKAKDDGKAAAFVASVMKRKAHK